MLRYGICIIFFNALFFLEWGVNLSAQSPQFSQYYAAPLILNPGFTGNTTQFRAAANYRHQWPSIPGAFVSYSIAFDQYLESINSGIGLLAMRDQAGTGGLSFTSVHGMYSYNVQISRKLAARAGASFGMVQRSIDLNKLTFTDQLIRGVGANTSENLGGRRSYFDMSSGLVFYGHKFWSGISVFHLNRPNESLLGDVSQIPMKLSLHGGYNIPVKKNEKRKVVQSLTFTGHYKHQKKFDQLDIGAYYNVEPLVFGFWYRGLPLIKTYEPLYGNNDAFVLMAGYELYELRIGYSYDITISRLVSNTGGSHEIAVIYEFAQKNRKRKTYSRRFIVPCAKF
jgi:type IX secretion system PorP/SprF family membrane protein